VSKWWAVLFGVVMFGCAASMVAAPLVGMWLPEGVSEHSADVDQLFYFILVVTTFFFVLTEGIMVWFMWRFAGKPLGLKPGDGTEVTVPQEQPESLQPTWFGRLMKPVTRILHDQHRVEMAWTIIPAILLLYIAFAQIGAWARIKYESQKPASPYQVEVVAHQFGWRIRYPHPDRLAEWRAQDWAKLDENSPLKKDHNKFARVPHMDDLILVNELHTWVGQPTLVSLSTRDVIHSFNLPHMRVKQDALPGRIIPVWFTPTKSNTRFNPVSKRYEDGYNHETQRPDNLNIWDLACAELCGWGHYRMIGRLYVHRNQEEFMDWLRKTSEAQQKSKS
jgi:cytochrome c oxidase subunit 2